MAKLDTFKDNFNDNSISASWTNNGIDNWVEQNSQLEGGPSFTLSLDSTSTYDFEDSWAFMEVVDYDDVDQAVILGASWNSGETSTFIAIYGSSFVGDNPLVLGFSPNDNENELFAITYNPSDHKWLRIRESAGVIYFDASANGSSWNNLGSDTYTGDISAVTVAIQGINFIENPIIVDNFNVIPSNIKKINGISLANIKNINGVPLASLKAISGVTN